MHDRRRRERHGNGRRRPAATLASCAVAMLIAAATPSSPAAARTRTDVVRAADTHTNASAAPRAQGAAAKPRAPMIARYRVRAESSVDLGWTGMAHQQPWPSEQRLEFTLACPADGTCAVGGGAAGAIFGAPVPLSTGGVPACVVSRLRAPLAGSADPASGCGELRLALATTVYTGPDVSRPCPRCDGDRVPNDGRKDGRCVGGAASGNPCDASAASTLFGATSNDCLPPPASAVGTLAIDVAPLTTGNVRVVADRACALRRPGIGDRCACPGQLQPNACDAGTCGGERGDERCDGPVDGVCAGAPSRGCTLGSGARECEDVARGAGTCEMRVRPCFDDVITAAGVCDRAHPTYVAIFCAPATQAPAINSTAGLPGPARLRLALEALPARSPGGSPAARRSRRVR